MPQRRLLYLDASQLSASLWQAGTLREEARFAPGEDGVAAFSEYLAKHRSSQFYLLGDMAEEGFQIESVPYTQGADRSALLTRKLGQYFYGSPLATAISFGRERAGRRDERILFTALTRPQLFEPWLAAARAAEARLAGVYSLPLVGAGLLEKIQPARQRCLLVNVTRAGVRQSYFDEGQIRFSRLTSLAATGTAEVARVCAAESAKMFQYVLGQRLIARGTPLPAIVLAHPAQTASFANACRDTEELQFQIVDLHALGHSCGLKSLPADSRGEALFLHLLAQRPPRQQFAPAADRRFFRLAQLNSALRAVGVLALCGCLLFAAERAYQAYDLRNQTTEIAAQGAADAEKYAAIQRTFPPVSTSVDNLRAVTDRYSELEKRSAPLEPLFLAVSRGLQQTPAVDIDRIDWLLGSTPDENLPQAEGGKTPPAAAADKAALAPLHAIAVVHGALPVAMAADQRGQLEAVNRFADALRQDASLRVTIQRMPFDVESGKSLKSGGETASAASQPKFVVHISGKL